MIQDTLEVLLIKDNSDEAILIKEFLKANYKHKKLNIKHTKSLSEGLKNVKKQKFDVILLDL